MKIVDEILIKFGISKKAVIEKIAIIDREEKARIFDMPRPYKDEWDEMLHIYNERKIEKPIPVLFMDEESEGKVMEIWEKLGIKCGYIKIPVVGYEDFEAAQKAVGCVYPNRRAAKKEPICGATNLPCSECMPCCESRKENGNG